MCQCGHWSVVSVVLESWRGGGEDWLGKCLATYSYSLGHHVAHRDRYTYSQAVLLEYNYLAMCYVPVFIKTIMTFLYLFLIF